MNDHKEPKITGLSRDLNWGKFSNKSSVGSVGKNYPGTCHKSEYLKYPGNKTRSDNHTTRPLSLWIISPTICNIHLITHSRDSEFYVHLLVNDLASWRYCTRTVTRTSSIPISPQLRQDWQHATSDLRSCRPWCLIRASRHTRIHIVIHDTTL